MRQFVPMTDELLYRTGGPPGRLVPYRAGLPCWRALGSDGIYHFDDGVPDPTAPMPQRTLAEAANDVALTSPPLARQA